MPHSKRQAWPEQVAGANEWPGVFKDSWQWCFLSLKPGTDPLKALVDSFLDVWQFEAEYERVREQKGWIELLLGNGTLSDLVEATERRRAKLDQPKPPAFMLYVDQGEELYVRSGEQQRQRFSELLAQALSDPRLRTMMSLRADFLGPLSDASGAACQRRRAPSSSLFQPRNSRSCVIHARSLSLAHRPRER